MEPQEKSFRDMQQDERLKRLERHLKLTQIKRPNSSHLLSAPHMSISSISSIHGDNPLSDFSYCSPSGTSSRAGSVILGSSINLRKKLSKNLNPGIKMRPSVSSVFDQSLEDRRVDEDRVMMPPPLAIINQKPQSSNNAEPKGRGIDSVTNGLFSPSCETQTQCSSRNMRSVSETHQAELNNAVETDASRESSRSKGTSKKYGRIFNKWIVRLNAQGQIVIKGKLESGEQARSKAIKKRLTATMVLSVLNHKYLLVGDIHDVREELPEYIRGKFYNGFPVDWENVHQIWQCYVASGSNLHFRWPRPMADSDDDLRSDITELTVLHPENSKTVPTSFVSTPRAPRPAREIDGSSAKNDTPSQRQKITNDPDISLVHSMANGDTDARAGTSILEASCKNTVNEMGVAPNNHSANLGHSASGNIKFNEIKSSNCGNVIQRWKIDIIIDNLMNKHCNKEYIDKFIEAINCFNELLKMPSTNSETTTDEGVSLNYNSNGFANAASNKIHNEMEKAETLQNEDSSRLQHTRQAAASTSNSYSLEISDDSETEPPSQHNTYVCKQASDLRKTNTSSYTSMASTQLQKSPLASKNLSYSDTVNRDRNNSTPIRFPSTKNDTRDWRHEKDQVTPALSRKEILQKQTRKSRHKRRTIFDSTDSDTDALVSNESRPVLNHNSLCATTNSQRVFSSKQQPVVTEKRLNGIEEGVLFCDSDISIVDVSVVPSIKSKVSNNERKADNKTNHSYQRETERSMCSVKNNENNDHNQADTPVSKRNEKTVIPTSTHLLDKCTVRLNKITMDEHNRSRSECTPAKSEKKTVGRPKSKVDTSYQNTELHASDSENLSMRMSSRGRRILPPLDYWNGERVVLRGQKLIYSPGRCNTASLSANSSGFRHSASLASPNNTAVSEPVTILASANNSNKTPTRSADCLKTVGESVNKNTLRIEGILSEISANHDTNIEQATTSQRKITKTLLTDSSTERKKNLRAKNHRKNSESSSEDEKINLIPKRKRRRIY